MTESEKAIEAILAWCKRKPDSFYIGETSISKNNNNRSTYVQYMVHLSRNVVKTNGWFKSDTYEEVRTPMIKGSINTKGQWFTIEEKSPEKVEEIRKRIHTIYRRRADILDNITNVYTDDND